MGSVAICWATQPAKAKPGTRASGSALPGPLGSVGVGSKGPAAFSAPHCYPRRCRRLPGGGAGDAEAEPGQPCEARTQPYGIGRSQPGRNPCSRRQKAPGLDSWKRSRSCAWGWWCWTSSMWWTSTQKRTRTAGRGTRAPWKPQVLLQPHVCAWQPRRATEPGSLHLAVRVQPLEPLPCAGDLGKEVRPLVISPKLWIALCMPVLISSLGLCQV